MKKKLAYAYGILCYLIALATFLYLIGFVGNLVVPKSVDSGPAGPFWQALAIDALVIGLFALQHSGMARPTFKRWWTKIIPRPIERSTYVVLTCLSLGLIFWLWRPLPVAVWNLEMAWARWLLWALYGLGWIVVFVSVQLIDSDYLFGRRQTREYLEGVKLSSPQFQTPGFYRYVRHPLVLGFLVAFWATPHMTVGHLLLAMVMTGYVLAAIQLEERNLMQRFGHRYRAYREQVPMLIPQPGSGTSQQGQWEA